MGSIEASLVDGEHIVCHGQRHWAFHALEIARTCLIGGVGAAALAAAIPASRWVSQKASNSFEMSSSSIDQLGIVVAGAFVTIGVVALGVAAYFNARYFHEECAVTNRRLVIKRGFIRRRVFDISLRHIEAVDVDQTVWGRILGFGTVAVSGTGKAIGHYPRLFRPMRFRRTIHSAAQSHS